ncbi:hypothetical protein E8E13_000290 [Curvularia kusanoi]|uniref:Protein kinase domain-containing protein n=1 Tax=Curvularia kusanoi TaxID=90978 RepID=A0A9P4T3V4_CURKU|nr:hypothetical protein E8E13_000290 [Curvularia kusanoi]
MPKKRHRSSREPSVERCVGCNEAWRRPIPDIDQELAPALGNADYMRLTSNFIDRLRDQRRRVDAAYEDWKHRHSFCHRPASPQSFGWTEDHVVLESSEEDILEAVNPLGHGSLGVVEEVRRIGGYFATFVRKRVRLPPRKKDAAAYLKFVEGEARTLRSLVHLHIVTLVGSYEDRKQPARPSYCLLMAPVGDNDLKTLLSIVGEDDMAPEDSIYWRSCMLEWMACLASALKYMHASGIRHQDIKPSNIIHKGNHVLFSDFSSSSSFKIGHTTSTGNPAHSTPMYGAPEVTWDRGRHGLATDIFALGCVFSDMLTVTGGRAVQDFQDHLRNNDEAAAIHSDSLLRYSQNVPAIRSWFADSHIFNAVISPMLQLDRKMRTTADEVLQALIRNDCCDMSCSCLQDMNVQEEPR